MYAEEKKIRCEECDEVVGVVYEWDYDDCKTNTVDEFHSNYGGEIDGESYCCDCYEWKQEELRRLEYSDEEAE